MKKIYSVEEYLENNNHFKNELEILRSLLLSTELEETIKWNAPTYTLKNKNVIGLGAFKNHFCLWFFNGVFLEDKHNLLFNAQDGKTKALRQLRFTSIKELNQPTILSYIKEAIENQKLGKELKPTKTTSKSFSIPKELQLLLNQNSELEASYKNLSPSKQKEYCLYIKSAKREATKISRLEKIAPLILKDTGLHDKYKNC
ncbi:YdeI family protein [Aurantibacter sp.]|uniref:YdeI/OmpD-associated family protein n=1 Tax=Aurantibacter sp. TaxID=2807103 RepID=UPI0035C81FA7